MTFDPNQVKIGLVKDMDTAFQFLDWIRNVPDQLIGLDVETAGLGWYDGKLRLVQFGTLNEGWAIPYQENRLLVREALEILSRRDKFFVLHNAKFDIHYLERSTGWVPKDWRFIHDTLLMGTVLNSAAAKGLKDLAEWYVWSGAKLGEKALKDQFRKHGWFWDTVPVDLPEYWIYGVLDTIMTVNLFYILHRKCEDAQVMDAYYVELGVLPALYAIEKNGMLLDSEHCHKYIDQLTGRAHEIELMVFEKYGIENLNSTNQLALALLREGVVLTERTKTGWKMNKDTFELLAATQNHPLLDITTEYRSATRMSSTYFGNFLQHQRSDGRCHPFYWATEAKTGRMSATEPAIQTVPRPDDDKAEFVREVRNSFVAPDGSYYVSCDFSNMEARVFADFADEQGMKQAFIQELNLHKYTASQIFDRPYESIEKTHSEYTVAKNTLFCTLFGGGETQIAITAKIPIEKAREAKRGLYLKFPNMPIFQNKMARLGEDNLHAHGQAFIRGIDGRILAMKDGDSRFYAFTNWLIQSSSCTILKWSLTTMHNMGWSQFMVAAIHDEILGEVPEDLVPDYQHAVKEAMTDHYLLSVPIVCAVGQPAQRWGDAK